MKFTHCSLFSGKGTIKRAKRKRKTCFSFRFRAPVPYLKVQLSGQSTKGKLVFLFVFERKCLIQRYNFAGKAQKKSLIFFSLSGVSAFIERKRKRVNLLTREYFLCSPEGAL
jgi:hypothetical protein